MRLLSSLVICCCICATASAFTPMTDVQFNQDWNIGKQSESPSKQENPDRFAIRLKEFGTLDNVFIATNHTVIPYIAMTEKSRLLSVPLNLHTIAQDTDSYAYIITSCKLQRNVQGQTAYMTPTQRLVIKKGEQVFYPLHMNDALRELLPNSYGTVFYAFPKELLQKPPYTILFVGGVGDLRRVEVTEKMMQDILEQERTFKPAP